MQTDGGLPAALGNAAGTDHWFPAEKRKTDNTISARTLAAHTLCRRQLVAAIHCLGSARVWGELLDELERERYGVRDLDARLARYAQLAPDILRDVRADRFRPPPIRVVTRALR